MFSVVGIVQEVKFAKLRVQGSYIVLGSDARLSGK